ncbi:hypothetical protein B0H14DRAFT_2353121, partial [Mycena olivaceomarginata]
AIISSDVWQVPDSTALESAVTVPDHVFTSLHPSTCSSTSFPHPSTAFPAPSPPPNHTIPILVYGAGSTTGQHLEYALQLLHAASHTNILTTASHKHHAFLCTLGATHVFNYASPTLTADIACAVGGDGKVVHAVNAITVEGTLARIAEVLKAQGTLTLLLLIKVGDNVAVGEAPMHRVLVERNPFPAFVMSKYVQTFTGTYAKNVYFKDNLMPKILP